MHQAADHAGELYLSQGHRDAEEVAREVFQTDYL